MPSLQKSVRLSEQTVETIKVRHRIDGLENENPHRANQSDED